MTGLGACFDSSNTTPAALHTLTHRLRLAGKAAYVKLGELVMRFGRRWKRDADQPGPAAAGGRGEGEGAVCGRAVKAGPANDKVRARERAV